MFYKGDEVRTCQQVTKDTKDILVSKGIKPGTKGIVISEVTHVTVSFNGTLVTLREDAIELAEDRKSNSMSGDSLDALKDMFGFK